MKSSKSFLILVINPGSTSTKIGIFEDELCKSEKILRHSSTELEKFEKIWDQYEFRKREILAFLKSTNVDLTKFHCVVGRGGPLKPIESGTYRVDERMINDLRCGIQGQHASNLGGVLAYGIGWDYSIPSFIVDPISVDELEPVSRYSGIAEIPRYSLVHALNIKATARKVARDIKRPLEDLNLIVAHLGGGITVAALKKGRIVDVNNGLCEGPFTPERSGSVPLIPLVEMCFSGKYDKKSILKKIVGKGGLTSYLNTNSCAEVEALIRAGNTRAKIIFEAMAYQISTEIGARAVTLFGKVDGIILTGGMAHSAMLTNLIEERCSFLGNVQRYPGEDELEALALGGLRVLRGEEAAKTYDAKKKSIGIFFSENLQEYDLAIQALERELREHGYRFRQSDENLEIIVRNAHGNTAIMHDAAEEFLARNVDLVVSIGSPAAAATKLYLKGHVIPVICVACFDPVVMGLAESYAGSGNNIAGNCYRIDIENQIKEGLCPLIPGLKRLGVIYKSGELQSEIQLDETREVGQKLGFEVICFDCQTPEDLTSGAVFFRKQLVQAVFLASDTTAAGATEQHLMPLTEKIPTLCALESTVKKGGLVGRVADWDSLCKDSVGIGLDILEGAAPAKIPISRNPNARTIINLRTAKMLGIKPSEEFMKSAEEKLFADVEQ
ncbi:MAG: butyrate kinase [Candidatus Riflebacteria bacterium]|nr:butyrate kinase [Candidatus Riflebacteria bacterium]